MCPWAYSSVSHPLRIPFHTSGRAKSNSYMYFRMCAKSLVRYRALVSQLEKMHHLDAAYDSLFERVEEAAVEPVVLAGMSLEASLFDLSACLFGEEFAAQTDKLDPIARFFVLSHNVNRVPPSAGSVAMQSIQALVTARNRLIHHKSRSALEEDGTSLIDRSKKEHEQHVKGIAASFRALVLLSLHFDGNIFEELRILPSFKKQEYWQTLVPVELHEDVQWCIQAAKREGRRANKPLTDG
jgi:hypothetical protein